AFSRLVEQEDLIEVVITAGDLAECQQRAMEAQQLERFVRHLAGLGEQRAVLQVEDSGFLAKARKRVEKVLEIGELLLPGELRGQFVAKFSQQVHNREAAHSPRT